MSSSAPERVRTHALPKRKTTARGRLPRAVLRSKTQQRHWLDRLQSLPEDFLSGEKRFLSDEKRFLSGEKRFLSAEDRLFSRFQIFRCQSEICDLK